MRSRSSVVAPDRRPWPCSARRTQWRSVSPEQPIFSAIEWIADHCEVCSAWWSRTIRTARARTSGEYGGTRFVMAPSSQELEPPENPARFIISGSSRLWLSKFQDLGLCGTDHLFLEVGDQLFLSIIFEGRQYPWE